MSVIIRQEGDFMSKYENGKIVTGCVTGIENYGIFVSLDEYYSGLIHISEISYGYVKNINDFMNVGDSIYAEVLNIDDSNRQIKLSIKDIDYKKDGVKLKRMAETKSGFAPLRDNLDNWINDKIKEITDNF